MEKILNEIKEALENVTEINELNDIKVKYMGKKGVINDLTSKLKDLTVEEKKCCGKSYNSYIVNKVYETNDYFKADKLSDILNNIPDEIKEKYIQGPSD